MGVISFLILNVVLFLHINILKLHLSFKGSVPLKEKRNIFYIFLGSIILLPFRSISLSMPFDSDKQVDIDCQAVK